MDDDVMERFGALSKAELRRRVDLAVAYMREMRCSLAVHAGMVLEQAPLPIPEIDLDQAKRAFEEIVELHPLRRTPLTPAERARLRAQQPSAAEKEAILSVIDAVAEAPEAFDAAAKEAGATVTAEQLTKLREHLEKVEMLAEVGREMDALRRDIAAYQAHLDEEAGALRAQLAPRRGPVS
jgi:hypothetical protein